MALTPQEILAGLSEIIDAPRNRTLRYSILHGLHDEAWHQGEMHLLKKLLAKR